VSPLGRPQGKLDAVRAIWQDIECGSYSADLEIWEDLARGADGPILDLGCGTGRVALHLARRGHEVVGIDIEEELVLALDRKCGELPLKTQLADMREFELDTDIALAVGPMHALQLLPNEEHRRDCLFTICAHLLPGGRIAVAIVEEPSVDVPSLPPETRAIDGWLYSSQLLSVTEEGHEIAVRRRRETVSPAGERHVEENEERLQSLSAIQVEAEGLAAWLRPSGRLTVPPTELYCGSTVVVLERPLEGKRMSAW
jgi:SAM-dependent methyltransferase